MALMTKGIKGILTGRDMNFGVTVTIKGKGGHSSAPYKARNPIVAGNELIRLLSDKMWFELDSFDNAMLVPVSFNGGYQYNVIPDTAEIAFYGECAGAGQYERRRQQSDQSCCRHGNMRYRQRCPPGP